MSSFHPIIGDFPDLTFPLLDLVSLKEDLVRGLSCKGPGRNQELYREKKGRPPPPRNKGRNPPRFGTIIQILGIYVLRMF